MARKVLQDKWIFRTSTNGCSKDECAQLVAAYWAAGPIPGKRKRKGFWQEVAGRVVVEGGAQLGVNMYLYLVKQPRWWHEQYTLHFVDPASSTHTQLVYRHSFACSWTCNVMLRCTLCKHVCCHLLSCGHYDMRGARRRNLRRTRVCEWHAIVLLRGRMGAPRRWSRQPRGIPVHL